MATIKPIEGRSVHQIQSGQVIVDLCSVAKELVENSVDAGSTSIEVRFKNNGLDLIEVQDNGSGIAPDDFETIALKHYTSKLSTYDDLTSLQTFGFRGEALSSLCALSKFYIVTARAADGPKGTKLDFETSGKLKGTSVVASKQGTTVVVESLFYNLPVRRKELEKSIKREYGKVLALLHAYACISTGVKFSVSNQMPKGKKTIAFSTNSNPNTKENIANVYGAKTLLMLIPLNLKFEMDANNRLGSTGNARNWSTQEDPGSREVKILGHISRPVIGEGRQTPDRQMFFVNSRPCALPQVAKAFNEVYRSYNITQSPFIFADIKLDTNAYDVNVSPDKRTILLHDQTTLLESLKSALVELFEAHDQSVPQAQLSARKLPYKPLTIQRGSVGSAAEEDEAPETVQASKTRLSSEEAPPQKGFVKASLIGRFAVRDTEERVIHQPARRRESISPEKQDSSKVLEDEAESAEDQSVLKDALPIPPEELPRPVQDFNARIPSKHAEQMARERSPRSPGPGEEEEDSIPAIKQNPQKRVSQSTVQNAFDRMRPMRTPVQEATITVGDTTTVSTIGSSSRASKRARIYTPKFSLDGTPLSQTPKTPLLLKSLRGFAAPGTQMEESEGEDDEGESSAAPDSSMPDAPAAAPLSPKKKQHFPQISVQEPSTNDLYEESSDRVELSEPPQIEGQEEEDTETAQPEPIQNDEGSDNEYIDEFEKRAREEAKIAKMIAEAEEAAARPTDDNIQRATKLLAKSRKQYATTGLVRFVETSAGSISQQAQSLRTSLKQLALKGPNADLPTGTKLNTRDPEECLSLTVSKSDFNTMHIIGQFNLGFILAVRPSTPSSSTPDLFIIDQHASDEKYNFERFTASTILSPQRLVHPHPLELTAVEEEIILSHENALTANGFVVSIDTSGALPVGQRAKLVSLPMSKEVTFTPTDLEELLALISENPPSNSMENKYVPRPSKVRKLLASRACRGSVMVGKTLTERQMEKVVRHMGCMDKPWSCPHGRPTMRHLFGLEKWEWWAEGDGISGLEEEKVEPDWGGFLKMRQREMEGRGKRRRGVLGMRSEDDLGIV
ncbi:DNA mismatch repair protein MutL [Zopfia rhizophila CBS 207.26]|uniref:DNA mismatch repair protein PMS1 n=1 Tax=Zopfia rhizophila CBS 207.26 TaxID=1314779 RepID=A0A6A6EPX3_9PEZI|nr:DNA mismatch repair protein MutL [Zopfia rhizophila CBS 207.26]